MNNFPCYMFILLQTLFSLGASFAKSLVLFAVLRFCTAACLTGFCGSLCVHPGACGTNLPHDGFKLLWLLLGRWLWCYCSHGWLHQRLAYTAPRFQLSSSSFPAFVVVSVRIARFLWSVVKLKAKLSQKPFMQKKKNVPRCWTNCRAYRSIFNYFRHSVENSFYWTAGSLLKFDR